VLARRAELLVNPANLAPLAFGRNVVVIHDAAALREPAWYSRAYVAWQRVVLPRIARRARRVVTVSEFSRRELTELLGVDAAVVPGGVDERFAPGPKRTDRPYVLTVASRTARKNLAALDETARRLRAQGIELLAAGGGRPQFRDGDTSPVRAVGHVPDEELPALYAGALAFVLPSLYEGFGLPCLEAMASGTPVVTADRGALPETCGDAALLVDPTDPAAIADAVLAAIGDDALRARGLARAAAFPWERTVGELRAVLASA
jgi:glycosyltransferase involved in cell wall biosynthesis